MGPNKSVYSGYNLVAYGREICYTISRTEITVRGTMLDCNGDLVPETGFYIVSEMIQEDLETNRKTT